jgi:hypothetical protein
MFDLNFDEILTPTSIGTCKKQHTKTKKNNV